MPTYINNLLTSVSVTNRMGYNRLELKPGESKEVPFYIDPSVGLTLTNDTGNIDTVLDSDSLALTATPVKIDIPFPKLSYNYRITMWSTDNKDFSIKFNVTSNKELVVKAGEVYSNVIIWEYAPKIYLYSATSANIKYNIEEVHYIGGC